MSSVGGEGSCTVRVLRVPEGTDVSAEVQALRGVRRIRQVGIFGRRSSIHAHTHTHHDVHVYSRT